MAYLRNKIAIATLTAILAAQGCSNNDETVSAVAIQRDKKLQGIVYKTGMPATILISYPANGGYFIHINEQKVDLGNPQGKMKLHEKGVHINKGNVTTRRNLNESIDALAIVSDHPGELSLKVQGYDASTDTLTIRYAGDHLFEKPPLETKEDTLKYVASTGTRALGLGFKDLGSWLTNSAKGIYGEAKEKIEKWREKEGEKPRERDREKRRKGYWD